MASRGVDISAVLSTHPLVIECILQNLGVTDLINASLVCKNWHAVANKIRRSRTKLSCDTLNLTNEIKTDNIFKKIINKEGLPKYCLIFIKWEFYMDYSQYLMKNSLHDVHWQLERSLPSNCGTCVIVGPQFPHSHNKYDPNDTEKIMSVTFPDIRGVNIKTLRADAEKDDVDEWIKVNFTEKNLSFLLLIGWSAEAKLMMDQIVLKLRAVCDNFKVGAIILSCTNMDEEKNTLLEGIAFYGQNLKSQVVNMNGMDLRREQIEDKILHLKSDIEIRPEKSLILMFAEHQRRVTQLDLEMLGGHFPETAVVGTSVFDVLSWSESGQLESSIKHWQVPYQPPVCDKRACGPSQIILLSWQ